jgi:hypothetical protein
MVREVPLARGVRSLRVENDLLAATVLLDKGADIYELVYKPRAIDVLWKSPWGLKRPGSTASAFDSSVAWLEAYAGGWQEIFPNGGDACLYKGVELNFHGEASLTAWDVEITTPGGATAEVALRARLYRSPFLIERTMRVEAGRPVLLLRERVTNEGGEGLDYMWGHHPAYGAPFLGGSCRIDVGARRLRADERYDSPVNPLVPDAHLIWPMAERDGRSADLSRVPDERTPQTLLAYFEFEEETAWYGITNTEQGFGVGLVWPAAAFPYAWFWQELHASPGFPWYKGAYVMAIEPSTSIPGQGLVTMMEKTGLHRTLAPGESAEAELRAVFYDSSNGITRIEPDGTVVQREG